MTNSEQAMTNRSIRNIRTVCMRRRCCDGDPNAESVQELEFLSESGIVTTQQITAILTQLPPLGSENTSLLSPAVTPVRHSALSPVQPINSPYNEKQSDYYAPVQSRNLPPPAYAASQALPSVAIASALYEYQPSDAGDLAILPNDRVSITEFMNADWAKGRNERTGLEGIFPRSYVEVMEEKEKNAISAPPPPTRSNYGNLPLDISQGSGGGATAAKESKLNENGKKFGKKMGNAGQSTEYSKRRNGV